MKKVLFSLLAAHLLAASLSLDAFSYANPARDEAMKMMRHRDYNDALNKLNEAIGFNATDPENYMLRGKCFFLMRNYQLAIEDFNHVLQYSPNYSRAFLWRGTAHARLGADDMAIKDYEQAIRLRPALARNYFMTKTLQLPGHRAGATGPAITDYQTAMTNVYPNGLDPNAPVRTGSADPMDEGTDEFSDIGDASGDLAPEAKLARTAAGGGPNAGRGPGKGYYQALAGNPAGTDLSTTNAGNTDVGRADDRLPADANRRVTNNFDVDPNFGRFGPVAGSQPMQGDPEKVIKETTEALRINYMDPELYFKRAKAWQALQQPNKAYADYNEAIRIFPQAKFYVGRASLFYQLNKPLLVDADVRSAVLADPTTPRKIDFGGDRYPNTVQWDGDGPGGS